MYALIMVERAKVEVVESESERNYDEHEHQVYLNSRRDTLIFRRWLNFQWLYPFHLPSSFNISNVHPFLCCNKINLCNQ